MNTRRKLVLLLVCAAIAALSSVTLVRCGSGVGAGFDSNVNGMKF